MKTGTLEITRRLHCPYCGNTEDADEVGQYQDFECEQCDNQGTVQIWKCLRCEESLKICFE